MLDCLQVDLLASFDKVSISCRDPSNLLNTRRPIVAWQLFAVAKGDTRIGVAEHVAERSPHVG